MSFTRKFALAVTSLDKWESRLVLENLLLLFAFAGFNTMFYFLA